jgi:hypothetical protein
MEVLRIFSNIIYQPKFNNQNIFYELIILISDFTICLIYLLFVNPIYLTLIKTILSFIYYSINTNQ